MGDGPAEDMPIGERPAEAERLADGERQVGVEPLAGDSPPGAAEHGAPPKLRVLTKRSDFVAANRGIRVSRPGFVLLARDNSGPDSDYGLRFGITVTKRIGNAVVRNRMKRRFRALLRELLPVHGLPAHDHVLIGREGGVERDFATLRAELIAAFARARAGKGDPPRGPRAKGKRAGKPGGKGGGGGSGGGAPRGRAAGQTSGPVSGPVSGDISAAPGAGGMV